MKKLAVILVLFTLFTSCKEEVAHIMRIKIKNDTNSELTIYVYAKEEYVDGTLYRAGDGYQSTIEQLASGSNKYCYLSSEQKKPNELAAQVFDSIHIVSSNQNATTIKFSPDTVVGYSENLFESNSFWTYETSRENLQVMFRNNPTQYHDYTFSISEEKY